MIVEREIEGKLRELHKSYPVITVTGPRQSGKTTVVRKVFPDKKYYSLENPDIREFAIEDPRGFLKETKCDAIIDEVQYAPKLLSYIQVLTDETNRAGQFVLTGSQQFNLMRSITQSLAGRTALLNLLPFSLFESNKIDTYSEIDQYLLKGFYPRVWEKKIDPTQAYRDYYETYIKRDLRELINIKDLSLFNKFVKLCAGRVGQVFNSSIMANEIGVSPRTIQSWVSILETSYVLFLLQPYFENIGKRLIKSPKLYFYDVGLAAYLLGIEEVAQIRRDPARGNLIENLVLLELVKRRFNEAKEANLYFYRDKQQHEIDIVIKKARDLHLVEIKSSETFNKNFVKNIMYLKKILPDRVKNCYLIYTGDQEYVFKDVQLLNFFNIRKVEV